MPPTLLFRTLLLGVLGRQNFFPYPWLALQSGKFQKEKSPKHIPATAGDAAIRIRGAYECCDGRTEVLRRWLIDPSTFARRHGARLLIR